VPSASCLYNRAGGTAIQALSEHHHEDSHLSLPLAFAACLLLVSTHAAAQYQVPQQTSYAMSAAERANLQLVRDWWRDIMLRGNLDIASHNMPVDFISRNPNVASGRDAFVQTLRTRPSLFRNSGQRGAPEVQFAKNEYVFLMWASFIIDPKGPATIYQYNTLDLLPRGGRQGGGTPCSACQTADLLGVGDGMRPRRPRRASWPGLAPPAARYRRP
jgi:predicted SnoaL-like aldol condensation-catalyzing enzyme